MQGNSQVLETVATNIDVVKDVMVSEFLRYTGANNSSQHSETAVPSGVLTGDQFQDIIRDSKLGISEF